MFFTTFLCHLTSNHWSHIDRFYCYTNFGITFILLSICYSLRFFCIRSDCVIFSAFFLGWFGNKRRRGFSCDFFLQCVINSKRYNELITSNCGTNIFFLFTLQAFPFYKISESLSVFCERKIKSCTFRFLKSMMRNFIEHLTLFSVWTDDWVGKMGKSIFHQAINFNAQNWLHSRWIFF